MVESNLILIFRTNNWLVCRVTLQQHRISLFIIELGALESSSSEYTLSVQSVGRFYYIFLAPGELVSILM